MKKLAAIFILPIALASITACGDEAMEDISLDEATYLSALEDEDMGTEEGDASGSAEEDPDVEEQFACSFDQIRERIRNRFDRNGNGDVEDDGLGPMPYDGLEPDFPMVDDVTNWDLGFNFSQ